jgi:tetratricopeptide (TPR) repeat protein
MKKLYISIFFIVLLAMLGCAPRGIERGAEKNTKGLLHLDKGRLIEAEIEFRNAIKEDPENNIFHSNLGFALNRQGRFEEAIPELERVEYKKNYDYTVIGQAYSNNYELEKAHGAYRKSIEKNSVDYYTYVGFVDVSFDLGRIEEEIKYLESLIENKKPTRVMDIARYSMAYAGVVLGKIYIGDYKDSIERSSKLLKIIDSFKKKEVGLTKKTILHADSIRGIFYYLRGSAYFRTGKYDLALSDYRKSI